MAKWCALWVVVSACGGGGGGSDSTVTVHALGNKLVAVQDESGPAWRTIPLDANGDAHVTFDGAFTLVTVCDEPEFFDYYAIFGGPGIEDQQTYCQWPADAVELMLPAAARHLTYVGRYLLFPGGVTKVPQGTYDVVSLDYESSPPKLAISRGMAITASGTIELLPTTPLESVSVTSDPAADETLSVYATLVTAAGAAVMLRGPDGDIGTAWRLPASLRSEGDTELVSARGYRDPVFRAATRLLGSDATVHVALPPGLTSATVSWSPAPAVSWTASSEWPEGYFYAYSGSALWDMLVSPQWTAAHGATTAIALPDPATVPGWDAAWPTAKPVDGMWSLSLYQSISKLEQDTTDVGGDNAETRRGRHPGVLAYRLAP